MMNERKRLIELMTKAENENLSLLEFEKKILADYLLENGVVVLPCKIGDTVYRISVKATSKIKYVQKTTISRIGLMMCLACILHQTTSTRNE